MNTGKVMLVTGGSRGIGAEVARLGAADGYCVAVNYANDSNAAAQLVEEIRAAGSEAIAVQADVADEARVVAMFATIDKAFGPVTALVNSAGVGGGRGPVSAYTGASLQRLFAINVVGTMLCCREAVARMSTRSGGAGGGIVNISSMAATIGGRAGSTDYAATKAAVDAFTTGLAKEVGDQGIRANALRPGVTLTDMTAPRLSKPEVHADTASTIAMRRVAHAREIAEPVLWLLSAQASFISGACLDASGGGYIVGKRLHTD